ncbi:MAG: pyridoxal-phosphate dependent enzyme [Pseudomonadales bacterium]|nr:pyridoxal-phosphate dependent enzyme [Pseudomonadales bacterium]
MTVTIETIRAAAERLQGVAIETPLLSNRYLNETLNGSVFIKPECLQHIGAFKFRGAYNRLCQLSTVEKELGCVAFSSGNHAQGIALAAKLLGMKATIVMPSEAPQLKLEGTERLGATVRQYDRATESREEIADQIAAESGATLVPAFDDWDIMSGQGTVGLEIAKQLQQQGLETDAVLTPAGGGGLLAGTSTAIASLIPQAKIYGVEQENFNDHYLSRQAGKRVRIAGDTPTMCDALMATTPGEMTWSINSKTVEDFLVVSEEEIAKAIAFAFRYLKLVVEPGGAVALAALLSHKLEVSGKAVCIVLSGGNIDKETFSKCVEKYPD